VKSSKVPKYIVIVSKNKDPQKKKPLEFPQEKTSSQSKNGGDPKKNENP
jgi:hypothetical protein